MTTDFIVHIVDDNTANRELFEDLMESIDLTWKSHASALEFLKTFDPEPAGCLILDVRMPNMSGLELLEKLNQDGVNVPIILATAHGDVPMAIEAMKRGAFDFHEKPINNQALREVDVYRLVVDGAMNKQIAYELDISQRTVEVHRAKVMEKMQARNLADLIKKHILLHGSA